MRRDLLEDKLQCTHDEALAMAGLAMQVRHQLQCTHEQALAMAGLAMQVSHINSLIE